MISGLTLITPMATPLVKPTATPMPSAIARAIHAPALALRGGDVGGEVGGHRDRQVDAAGQHAQRLAGGEDASGQARRRIERTPRTVNRLSSCHAVTR